MSQAKTKSYSTMMELGSKGVNYATSVIMQTAIKVSVDGERFDVHLLCQCHKRNCKDTITVKL